MEIDRAKKGGIGADHENIAVREIDEPQHPIDQGIAQRDERIDASQLQGIEYLL